MINNDAELIQQTLEGDQQAFAALVEKYQKQIHALAWQKIGDFHIAQEITQDVFLTAYHKLTTLKNPNRLAGWLYVIADRKCIAWHRKKKPQPESLDAMNLVELEEVYYSVHITQQREEAASQKRRELVQKLLSKLQESERTVVNLYYIAEMTCEDIGEFLGVSPNTVRSRLHRARNRLRNDETVIKESLGSFQLPTQPTENIMKKISRIKPAAPTSSKPIVPWTIAASSAILIILMLGLSSRHFSRFQHPYNLESQSELAVELIDAPIVRNLEEQPDARNQVGVLSDDNGKDTGPEQESDKVSGDKVDYTQWSLPKDAKRRFGKGGIAGAAYSPDSTLLAIASSVGIWIYDVHSGEPLALLTGHTDGVNSVSYSPDGKLLASGGTDASIRLWDVSTGALHHTLFGHQGWVLSLSFSPEGKVQMWNAETGVLLADLFVGEEPTVVGTIPNVIPHYNEDIRTVAVSSDGNLIAIASNKRTQLLHLLENKKHNLLKEIPQSATAFEFSPDNLFLAIGLNNGKIELRDTKTGNILTTLDGHTARVKSLIFSPDGKTLVSTGNDGTILLWDWDEVLKGAPVKEN